MSTPLVSLLTQKHVSTREISSSHGGEYDVQSCLLGCTADNHFTRQYNPEDRSKHVSTRLNKFHLELQFVTKQNYSFLLCKATFGTHYIYIVCFKSVYIYIYIYIYIYA
jgi:hypothetical protein